MLEIIKSRENDKIKFLCKLMKSSSVRNENKLFITEGIKLCNDISTYQNPKEVYYTQELLNSYPHIENFSGMHHIITTEIAKKISDVKTPQGIFCVFDMPTFDNFGEINEDTRLIVLDKVQDPGNVGTIIRTSTALGFNGIILTSNCADIYNPKTLRGAMSSTIKIPIIKTDDIENLILEFKAQNVTFLASSLKNSKDINLVKPSGAIAIVIGSEGEGISNEVFTICDHSICIPIKDEIESLNASIAAGILMWHYRKL